MGPGGAVVIGASGDLAWLVEALWGDVAGVDVSLGGTPAGRVALEEYRVVPGGRASRLLMPLDPKMAWAGARAASSTRSKRASFQRTLAGLAARSRLASAFFRDVLTVHGPPEGAESLASVLGEAVGESVGLAINVRPPGPYRKPVVQLIGPGGRVLAYAKVAWSDLTETNVEAEATALELVARGGGQLRAPVVIGRATWKERLVLLTEPMPDDLARWRGSVPPSPEITAALASLGGTSEASLREGPVLSRLEARWESAARAGALPEVARALKHLLEALGAKSESLRTGRWHGDWSPWNIGTQGEAVWAWDWEYSRPDVPVGLDVLHFHFQSAFIGERRDLAAAFDHARSKASQELASIGLPARAAEVVMGVHAAEVAMRYLEAEAAGASANPRFVREAVPVLRSSTDRVGGTPG